MDNILEELFLKEHNIKSVETIGELNIPGISLVVEFNNGDIEKRTTKFDMLDAMNTLMGVLNIRSRKKKLEKIMKNI